jgi:hypothetical protein
VMLGVDERVPSQSECPNSAPLRVLTPSKRESVVDSCKPAFACFL